MCGSKLGFEDDVSSVSQVALQYHVASAFILGLVDAVMLSKSVTLTFLEISFLISTDYLQSVLAPGLQVLECT